MDAQSEAAAAVRALLQSPATTRRRGRRLVQDRLATVMVALGGVGVIGALVLIFVYLVWVVLPLFSAAQLDRSLSFDSPVAGPAVHVAVEEQAELGLVLGPEGAAVFLDLGRGIEVQRQRLELGAGGRVTVAAMVGAGQSGVVALGDGLGRVHLVGQRYDLTYPDDRRVITPHLTRPYGDVPLEVLPQGGQALAYLAVAADDDQVVLAASAGGANVYLRRFAVERGLLDEGAAELEPLDEQVVVLPGTVAGLHLDPSGRHLYGITTAGAIALYALDPAPRLVARAEGAPVTASALLLGGISLLTGHADGAVVQWLPARDGDTHRLVPVRGFHLTGPVRGLIPEAMRKGLVAVGEGGRVGLYYSTSERTLLETTVADADLRRLALAPRGDAALAEDDQGRLHVLRIDNPHPEVSWSALWQQVWYENHSGPQYMWQSSAATTDHEPKFSLVPLSFGTFKAAFYAMLIAAPLAVLGAVYTAHFMDRRMRTHVKPGIEVMEALPTVILGFLAGLWLAPLVERNLPGVAALLLMLPLAMVLFGFAWTRAPAAARARLGDGWYALLLVPVVVATGWLAFALSQPLEQWLFAGDVRVWLTSRGIDFDQRNAIVVGFAMGFAVIPTIFSIAEDAIFSVPPHLTQGSLALGATPWQTLVWVVLPTASPGIFSALMIGLGRAVGETMIVLMATGNTPVMDLSVFQGMRTLAANIAVEMPESEVGSSHYRVLFLAGLVLFLFTFVINTGAEVVRQRLRRRYGSL